jgi:hypothetical protein
MIKDHALTACRRERLTVRNLVSRRGKTRVESVNTPAAGSAGLRGGDRVHGERPCLLWLTVRFATQRTRGAGPSTVEGAVLATSHQGHGS